MRKVIKINADGRSQHHSPLIQCQSLHRRPFHQLSNRFPTKHKSLLIVRQLQLFLFILFQCPVRRNKSPLFEFAFREPFYDFTVGNIRRFRGCGVHAENILARVGEDFSTEAAKVTVYTADEITVEVGHGEIPGKERFVDRGELVEGISFSSRISIVGGWGGGGYKTESSYFRRR